MSALGFLGAARLFKNQFFRNPYGPDVLPLLLTYFLQIVIGADVFSTSSRTSAARSYRRLFAESALVLVCEISWFWWGAIGLVHVSPMFLIRVFADPINAVAACGL